MSAVLDCVLSVLHKIGENYAVIKFRREGYV